jgi:hypothetical protein
VYKHILDPTQILDVDIELFLGLGLVLVFVSRDYIATV